MKIAILGAGNVGRALGLAWIGKGYDVSFGVPQPQSQKYKSLPAGRVMAVAEASSGADVFVLATPWAAAEAALRQAGDLRGKIVLDCTNPLAMGPDGLGLAIGFETSGGETVQGWAPGAAVFKTLNQTGAENMGAATRFPIRPVMFVAGDDAARRPQVMELVTALDFEAVDAGPLRNARLLEAYAMLWIDLALKRGTGRDFAFALVRRSE